VLQTAAQEAILKRSWRWNVARGPKRRPCPNLDELPTAGSYCMDAEIKYAAFPRGHFLLLPLVVRTPLNVPFCPLWARWSDRFGFTPVGPFWERFCLPGGPGLF